MLVQIVMATYNGSKFIKQQIDSIIVQSFSDWELLVHDDGSTDDTVNIIKDYVQKDSRVKLLDDGLKFHSSTANFIHLLKNADKSADYICLCDQDDVWSEKKLEILLSEIEKTGKKNEVPVCLSTDVSLIDSEGRKYIESFWQYAHVFTKSDFKTLVLENTATGCTMIFNRKTLDYVSLLSDSEISNIIQHDWYIALVCAADGIYKQIEVPLVGYRQHNENEVGARKTNVFEKLNPKKCRESLARIAKLKKRIFQQLFVVENHINDVGCMKKAKKFRKSKMILHKSFILTNGFCKSKSIPKSIIKLFCY